MKEVKMVLFDEDAHETFNYEYMSGTFTIVPRYRLVVIVIIQIFCSQSNKHFTLKLGIDTRSSRPRLLICA